MSQNSFKLFSQFAKRCSSFSLRYQQVANFTTTNANRVKFYGTADEAVADVGDGSMLLVGGFGLCGIPENLTEALHRKGVRQLTIASNNCGTLNFGLGALLRDNQIKRMISSHVGGNPEFEEKYLKGELELEI